MINVPRTVLVVGSLHYDIMVEADHLPRRDETAVGSRWYPKFGGKGGNQAVSARAHGASSRMIGAVGADDFGNFIRAHLGTSGVDHRFVTSLEDEASGMSVAIMDASGDYAATIVSGANLHVAIETVLHPQVWQNVGLLVLQNEVPESVNMAAAQEARNKGISTLLNAAPSRPLSPEFGRLVDVLVVNAVEAEMMGAGPVTNLTAAATAARKLADRFESVIVTAGALGLAAVTAGDEHFSLHAEKIKVVSSHGAGDVFIGALAACLIGRMSFEDACRAASRAAADHVAGRPAAAIAVSSTE